MECAESSRVGEYNLSYPRTSRIVTVADDEVCCYNSSVNYHRHKSNFCQRVISYNNSNNRNTNCKQYLKSPGIRIRSLHVFPLQRLFILGLLLILPLSVYASDINTYSNDENYQVHGSTHCNDCFIKRNTTIFIFTDNLTRILREISREQSDLSTVLSVEIRNSNLEKLNLSEFNIFPKVESITVTNCSLRKVEGPTPETVISLNISTNALKNLSASVFMSMESNYLDQPSNGTLPKLKNVDLSHNNLTEFPENIFQLQELQSLRIFANPFRCDFVWRKFFKWYITLGSNTSVLVDADETECAVNNEVDHFHYSVLGALKAKKTLEETCARLDREQCHGCELHGLQREPVQGYPIIHTSKTGSKISISLRIDCSSRNLTEMPNIPLITWDLNITNNHITDASPLKTNSNYSNLVVLEADNNEIDIDTLVDSPFLRKFSYLGLSSNGITSLPVSLLERLKNVTGQGKMTLGNNYIYCDCDTEREVKPILIMLEKRIKDVNTIYCENMGTPDRRRLVVKDLQYADVCIKETVTIANEFWLYVLIVTEVLLIIGVITKVWHDQRTFRQTGVLPWCSAKMPRLPCDAMLEGLKDHPNHNNNNGHQQLQSSQKEIRSGSSCTTKSGKSSRSSSAQSSSV